MAELIRNDPKLQKDLTKSYSNEEKFLEPIFYNNLDQQFLEELISDNDLFRIAGLIPGVNYQL